MSDFMGDHNKISDMLILSKDQFLESYSYLIESDYEETKREILKKLFEGPQYTVWVGAVEVVDYYVSYEKALKIYEQYASDGYDDVSIERGKNDK